MSDKARQKQLTKREREFAELRYRDELNDDQIAIKVGIHRATVYEWDKKPRIQEELERLGKADTQKALRFFQKSSVRAAKATVKLTETRPIKDEKGNVTGQDFVQPGEVVRKAAADILQGVEINVKAGEGGVNVNISEEKIERRVEEKTS